MRVISGHKAIGVRLSNVKTAACIFCQYIGMAGNYPLSRTYPCRSVVGLQPGYQHDDGNDPPIVSWP
jgi:hypothetical protein